MQRLLDFPIEDSGQIEALRRKSLAEPEDLAVQIGLGTALAQAGCTYEAAAILRPLRKHWKSTDAAEPAQAALEAQSWWNKNWREFAQLKHAGNKQAALKLLGGRAVQNWDLPALLVHLADFSAHDGDLDLAGHLYRRVYHLSQRGLPKMNMAAFEYVAQASLVDILLRAGRPDEALERHRAMTPNHGNVMAHELQRIKLLVATDNLDEAMRETASTMITAGKHRSGCSKKMRLDFIDRSPDLAALRERSDWPQLLDDPAGYLNL